MNLIKLIFIILFIQGLHGQAISTPKTIKPVVVLESLDENARVTFIGFEEIAGEYKTAKGYQITQNNNLIPMPEIFDWSLDPNGTSFFSGAHYKDITGEGIPELIMLITNPQTGTYIRSWTLGPGYTTKTPVHDQYYIKTKQKASEAISSHAQVIYEDKDYEIAICFGSPERKVVVFDYQGELKPKTVGKKFLENNVGPIELRIEDFNKDGMGDIYILSNGSRKEEQIYYSPNFQPQGSKVLPIEEKIKDIYFLTNTEEETIKILLLKNETIYVEEWNQFYPTNATTDQIIGHKENKFFILDKKGNIQIYSCDYKNKQINQLKSIQNNFQQKDYNKLEHLFFNENQVLISHNKRAEISLQTIEEEKKKEKTIENKTKQVKTEPKEKNKKTNTETSITKEEKNNAQKPEKEDATKKAVNALEKITIKQDSLMISVGEQKEILISLDDKNEFISLEKIIGPEKMELDKKRLAFIWEPTIEDAGHHQLQYRATYNTSDEYEVYKEEGIEKLRRKQDIQTTEHVLNIYVNARPVIRVSDAGEYKISANHEIIIPIYINDANIDQTPLIEIKPKQINNSKIENRKFYWTPQNTDYGNNLVTFIATDGFLQAETTVNVFVDTLKTNISYDEQTIITVNEEFVYDLPNTRSAEISIIDAPENVRISKEGTIHWIPTTPQLGNNSIIIEIKEKEQTYFYNMQVFVNAPPVISYRPDDIEYLSLGEPFSFTLRNFEQNENQKHYWNIKEKPKTMELIDATITWSADEPDYHKYHIELSDTIDVDNFFGYIYVNAKPTIISEPITYIELGDTLVYDIIVNDPNNQSPYDKNLKNEPQYFLKTFPSQMRLDKNKIIWIPKQEDVGQHSVEIEVYDGIEKAEQRFSLFVNDVPAIISDSNIKIAVGEELHHFVKALDSNETSNLTFGIKSNLDNMLMNSKTGEVLWTPTENDLGNHKIEVSVSDGFDLSQDVQTINLFVYKNPKFNSPTLPEAYAGVEYNYTLKASDMYEKKIGEVDVFIDFIESTFKEISFDKETYNLQIIPTFEELGIQYVQLALGDNYSNQIVENFPIKVLSSPCETIDTLYVGQEEVINKLQKIDKSIVYTSKDEKTNILGNKQASPDTIFITKYDTTITNITDSIFVTINNPESYKKENTKLTKRQKRKAERQASRLSKKVKQAAKKQGEKENKEEIQKEPLVITTQHKNINIINKETVVVEQVIVPEDSTELDIINTQENNSFSIDLGHNIRGIKTPKKDKQQQHLFGKKAIETDQKTEYIIPDFLNQPMYWSEE